MKTLAPDWVSMPFLRFVCFSFCATTTTSFKFKLEFHFLSRIASAKNTWISSATATEQIPKGVLSFLTRNSKRLFVSKAKNLIGFVWLKN